MKLTKRQENLLLSAIAVMEAAGHSHPRLEGESLDSHLVGWFARVVKGTRTPEPPTQEELLDLYRLINTAKSIEVET